MMLWVQKYVTGSGADSTGSPHPFAVPLLSLFSRVFSLSSSTDSKNVTQGQEKLKETLKKGGESGRKERAEGADHSLSSHFGQGPGSLRYRARDRDG